METLRAAKLAEGFYFPECPRWHQQSLWLSDFFEPAVLKVHQDGRVEQVQIVAGQPAGLGWLPTGPLLVVSRTDRKVLRVGNEGGEEYADLSSFAQYHANDMVVGPSGIAYVGHFGFDLDAFLEDHTFSETAAIPGIPGASILIIETNGTVRETADRLRFPNGMTFAMGGEQLIVAETLGQCLTAFDVATDGSLMRRRVWAETPGVAPDGICMDVDGAIWVANATAPECLKIEQGGRVLARVHTAENCFACCLGGQDGRTLFMTTAPNSNASIASRTRDGAVEYIRLTGCPNRHT